MYVSMYVYGRRLKRWGIHVHNTHTHIHTHSHTHTTEMMVRGDEVLEKAFSIRKLDLPYVRKLRNNGRE